jgi:hypothetical protein
MYVTELLGNHGHGHATHGKGRIMRVSERMERDRRIDLSAPAGVMGQIPPGMATLLLFGLNSACRRDLQTALTHVRQFERGRGARRVLSGKARGRREDHGGPAPRSVEDLGFL